MQRLFSNLSPYWRGSVYYLAFWACIGVYAPFLNLHWLEIGITRAQIGLLAALGPLMAMLLAPLVSRLADARGWHQVLLSGALGGTGFGLLLLALARDFHGVLLGSLFTSVTACTFGPLADGLIARMASQHQLEFGRMRLWGSGSFAAASLGIGFVWSALGYHAMLFVAGSFFMLLAPVAFLVHVKRGQAPHEQSIAPRGVQAQVWTPGLLVLLGMNLAMGFALGFVMPFLAMRMQSLGGSAIEVGALYAISASFELPAMRFERRVAARIGDAGVLTLSSLMFTLAYLGYALSGSPSLMLGFATVQGCAFGLFFVAAVRTIDSRAGALLGTLQSWRNALVSGIAPLIASPLSGLIAQSIGLSWVFVIAASFAALSAALVWNTRRYLEPSVRA